MTRVPELALRYAQLLKRLIGYRDYPSSRLIRQDPDPGVQAVYGFDETPQLPGSIQHDAHVMDSSLEEAHRNLETLQYFEGFPDEFSAFGVWE